MNWISFHFCTTLCYILFSSHAYGEHKQQDVLRLLARARQQQQTHENNNQKDNADSSRQMTTHTHDQNIFRIVAAVCFESCFVFYICLCACACFDWLAVCAALKFYHSHAISTLTHTYIRKYAQCLIDTCDRNASHTYVTHNASALRAHKKATSSMRGSCAPATRSRLNIFCSL